MYEAYFGLRTRPFASVPQIERYYPASSIEAAHGVLTRCVERGEGIGAAIGSPGTGKTLLLQLVASQLQDSYRIVSLSCGMISTRRAFFQAFLHSLDQPYRGLDEGELRLSLFDYLDTNKEKSNPAVLLLDEASNASLGLLNDVRELTNLAYNGQPAVRVVLAGTNSLEERLAAPKLASFHQRIAARCYVEAFSFEETAEYVRVQTNAAGGRGVDLFTDEACLRIHQTAEGIARVINQLCDHALLVTYAAGKRRVEPGLVDEAWADLQQLPTTSVSATANTTTESVIEFGSLDDEPLQPQAPKAAPQPTVEPKTSSVQFNFEAPQETHAEAAPPERQIARIERMIAEADDEFKPAGVIGPSAEPELELSFEELEKPFQESFDEEEVISERYTSSPYADFTPHAPPIVSTNPFNIPPQATTPTAPRETAAQSPAALSQESTSKQATVSISINSLNATEAKQAEQIAKAFITERPAGEAAEQTSNDSKGSCVFRPVKKHEYNRLFAKLRQGS